MAKFYCVALKNDVQICGAYETLERAQNDVIEILKFLHKYSEETAKEKAEAESYSRDKLGYGIIELEAESEEACWDIWIERA